MDETTRILFSEGAVEYLIELEEALLHLSDDPDNITEIDRVFRVMHSLKGSAAMVDYTDISEFAHALETEFDYIRRGQAVITPAIIKLTLKSHDMLAKMIETGENDPKKTNKLLEKLKKERKKAKSEDVRITPGSMAVAEIFQFRPGIQQYEEQPDNIDLANKTAHLISRMYYLSVKADLENITEFLSEFEIYYRKLRLANVISTGEVAALAHEVIEEAEQMFLAADNPEMPDDDMDPDKVMAALQRPLELQSRLMQIQQSLPIPEAALPNENEYVVSITLEKVVPGKPFSTPKHFVKALHRMGKAELIEEEVTGEQE